MPVQRKRPPITTTLDPVLLDRLRSHSETTGETLARLLDRAIRKLLASEEKRAGVTRQGEAA